jgi:CDP-diacylglycerol--glycerol-3-phosphate 3-phosphatidyltransferase
MSLANKITLVRAALIPPILILLIVEQREVAFGFFLVACLGDVLDGMVARRRGEVTTLGKALDPLVDKALYVSLLSLLVVFEVIPLLALLLFVLPQVGLGIGALFLHLQEHRVQGARIVGKSASVLTFLATAFLLLRLPYRVELFYIAIGATYLAALDYLRMALHYRNNIDASVR